MHLSKIFVNIAFIVKASNSQIVMESTENVRNNYWRINYNFFLTSEIAIGLLADHKHSNFHK